MGGKSYTDQMRSRRRRKKRKRHSQHDQQPPHHDDEEQDMQSQDLLAGDDDEQSHQQQKHQEQVHHEEELLDANEVQQDNATRRNNNNNNDEAAAVEVQNEVPDDRNDDSVPHHNRMEPPPDQIPTQQEEELKRLLSQVVLRETKLQEQNQLYRQALAASRQQCQQVTEELKRSQQQCEMYHKKYSDIKHKFYRWYNHYLKLWAAKFRQGQSTDLPPGPDTVGGISPQSSTHPSQQDLEEDASVLSELQPRSIFPDTGSIGSSSADSSVTPSPLMQRPINNTTVLQPQRLPSTNRETAHGSKENVENRMESHDSGNKQSPNVDPPQERNDWTISAQRETLSDAKVPVAVGRNDATKNSFVAIKENKSIRSNEDEDETQLELPLKDTPTNGDDDSARLDEDETQVNDPSEEFVPVKSPKANTMNLDAPANDDDMSVQSDCSDTQFILPEDDGTVKSEDDDDDDGEEDTQLDFPSSQNRSKVDSTTEANDMATKNPMQVNKKTLSDGGFGSRSKQFCFDEHDTTSATRAVSRPSEPKRKVSLSPTHAVPSPARSRHDKVLTTKDVSNSFVKRGGPTAPATSRRASNSLNSNGKRTSVSSIERENEESQALFSQLPPTPPKHTSIKKSTSTASKRSASSKNASALRAMEGWTSNVVARAFVQTATMNPPAKKKQRSSDEIKPDAVPSSETTRTTTLDDESNRSHLKAPPPNPDARSSKKPSNASSVDNKALDWSDDDDDSPKPYKYQEVVRCRHDRQQLPGHCCSECDRFADNLCNAEGGHVFNKKEFLGMSRHRARHTPENTPPGFWELSFADEIQAREEMNDDSP